MTSESPIPGISSMWEKMLGKTLLLAGIEGVRDSIFNKLYPRKISWLCARQLNVGGSCTLLLSFGGSWLPVHLGRCWHQGRGWAAWPGLTDPGAHGRSGRADRCSLWWFQGTWDGTWKPASWPVLPSSCQVVWSSPRQLCGVFWNV